MAAWFVESFPVEVRYSGVGVGYNFSQAFFGGPASLVATWWINQGIKRGPMYSVMFVCLCAFGTSL
eukprot:SAG31_NODE_2225_length_6150_cov_2.229549_4_plen_66_part_00